MSKDSNPCDFSGFRVSRPLFSMGGAIQEFEAVFLKIMAPNFSPLISIERKWFQPLA